MSYKAVVGAALAAVLLSAVSVQADVFNMGPGLTSLETVRVGDPGNAPDKDYGGGQFGAVAYGYRIAKYEVTNAQYCEFLNNRAVTDTYGLYNKMMTYDGCGAIDRSGASGSYTYSVRSGCENMPVTWVCWYDCVRFANWLQNGQGINGTGDTESGTYRISDGGYNSGTVAVPDAATRATWTDPHWVLPSEDEWYKAAYYQPASKGGNTESYWLYPTRSNSVPYSAQPPGSGAPLQANTANSYKDDRQANGYDDGYAVTGSTDFSSTQNYLTNVGAYTLSSSYYGTFDQGGNVWEWNDALVSSSRGVRGGGWNGDPIGSAASYRIDDDPAFEYRFLGFRVASVPEPGSVAMLVGVAVTGLLFWWRKRG
jgi:formylglycine-generating enzyme required for sulfatase activity